MRALVLASLLLLAGCASTVDGRTPGPPRSAPPAGQVVFRVDTGGGLTSHEHYLSGRPTVTIYGDGSAYLAAGRKGYAGYRPIALDRGAVPGAVLTGLIDDAEDSGLFTGKPDFGPPQVTDLPGTRLMFRPDTAAARDVSAYALDYREGDDRLTTGQRLARGVLRQLVDSLQQAVTEAAPWTPERVDVTDFDSGRAGGSQVWPGPSLATLLRPVDRGSCGVLTGADARRVYEAARTADSPVWRDGGVSRSLVFRVLLPGEPACAR